MSLLYIAGDKPIALAKLSFLDLFYLFPHYTYELKLSKDAAAIRRELRLPRRKDSYVHLPDIHLVYRELQEYQKVAIGRLVGRGILSGEAHKEHLARLAPEAIPPDLHEHLIQRAGDDKNTLRFIVHQIGDLPLDGRDSILRQTGLELGGRLR